MLRISVDLKRRPLNCSLNVRTGHDAYDRFRIPRGQRPGAFQRFLGVAILRMKERLWEILPSSFVALLVGPTDRARTIV